MKPYIGLSTVLLFLSPALGFAQAPPAIVPAAPNGVVLDLWQKASIDDIHSGWVHIQVQTVDRGGQKLLRGERTIKLTLKRYGDIARIDTLSGTEETEGGAVKSVFMTQGIGKDLQLKLDGVVDGDILKVTAAGKMNFAKSIPWRPSVVGVYSELKMFERKKPKIGDMFEYPIFEPIIASIVNVKAKVEGVDDIVIDGIKVSLWKMSAVPQEIQDFQLPPSTFWFDANYQLIRTETVMPGLGKLRFDRATMAAAIEPCMGPDLGLKQSIQLKSRLTQPLGTGTVVYRIELPNDKDPLTAFARDNRQSVTPMNNRTIELKISSVIAPPDKETPNGSPGKEFLESNFFINSDDPLVKQHATEAVGTATDPWVKAKLVESWVNRKMRSQNFTEAMATADRVAKTLEGDCTEYAMLAAAMCRAAGVPSRTAQGLVYVDSSKAPFLGFHMWTEVWVRGEWIGLDATLGKGRVGPGHLKVSDHSWFDTRTMVPIMPLMRVMVGGPQVSIVKDSGEP